MKIQISDKESTALLKAWQCGFIDTDKLGALCEKMAESLLMVNGTLTHPFEYLMMELDKQDTQATQDYENRIK